MVELQRITTQYSENEDRLQILGETASGATVSLWFTRRLMDRLLGTLLTWLDAQEVAGTEVAAVQAFQQDVAKSALKPQAPVVPMADTVNALPSSVDIAQGEDGVRLTFKSADHSALASLALSGDTLRQWLQIVHGLYIKAEWSTQLWPGWFARSQQDIASAHIH